MWSSMNKKDPSTAIEETKDEESGDLEITTLPPNMPEEPFICPDILANGLKESK